MGDDAESAIRTTDASCGNQCEISKNPWDFDLIFWEMIENLTFKKGTILRTNFVISF
jgi:hypothetical protein